MYEKRGGNQGGFTPVLFLALVVVIGIVGIIFYLSAKSINNSKTMLPVPSSTPTPISTIKPGVYKCPEFEYVDCMPRISDGKTGDPNPQMCSSDYLVWAKANCPNFKGVAY